MELVGLLILIGTLNALYFLPAIIASSNTNDFSVMFINLFLGWTFIGWVVALVMATKGQPKKELTNLIIRQKKEINHLKLHLLQTLNKNKLVIQKPIPLPGLV